MKYLDDDIVKELLQDKWGQIIRAIEEAFVDPSSDMVPKTYLQGEGGDFRAMPAALGKYAALKWIGVFPNNYQIPMPTTNGSLILSDRETGASLIGMDCTALTAYRTAATSAIVAKYCAPRAKKFAFIGCGLQAKYHMDAYYEVFGDNGNLDVQIHDKNKRAEREMMNWLGKNFVANSYGRNKTVKWAVRDAEVITTLTPSVEPYLDVLDLKSDCHINAVGADAVGKRELMTNVIDGSANIICDDPMQALHSGELQYNEWPHLDVNSMQYLIKNHETMQLDKGVSVFDSTGVAIEDIAIAELIYRLSHK